MTATTAVRTVDGVELPAAGTWTIDPAHTTVEFVARHMVVAKVRGAFRTFEGTIDITDDLSTSRVDVSIDVASVSTGVEDRDGHLLSEDFFDVANHPKMTFVGTRVEGSGSDRKVVGELTIRGVSQPVTLDVSYLGAMKDPWGNDKAMFSASAEIDREAFGLTWNTALESGGVLVGKTVKIEIEAQLAKS